jgi:uncharacterized protein with von Willebrand factor type A (vWA) domain
MIYAFGGLPENLASFCALLRHEYAFRIGSGELLDAARALDIVDLSSEQAVRSALRTILTGTRDDVVAFDEAFDRFFLPRPGMHGRRARSALEREPGAGAGREGKTTELRRAPGAYDAEMEAAAAAGTGPLTPIEMSDEDEAASTMRASYSPVSVARSESPEIPSIDDAWVAVARALVRRVQLGPARKWRPAARGRRFDLRRTLRASLQTGGEPLAPRWLARPRRQPRFIVFIDGSRSMNQYAGTALRLASALGRATRRVEVFTFSTALQRVTTDVQRASIGTVHRLHPLAKAWGGGTKIGASLAEFVRRFGERLLTTSTVVIVASDGLDVGEPETLRSAARAITRRSAALVWLNPLLETPGYEPTALGMSIARPFVTTFSAVNDLDGFVRLSRTLRVRT